MPRSVTLRFCEDAGVAKATAAMSERRRLSASRPLPSKVHESLCVRRFGLAGNIRAGFHELNDGVGELRGPGFSAYIASEFVLGAIDLFQTIVNLVGGVVFAEMAQHQLGGADDRGRVGQIFAGDVRRRSVHRFEDGAADRPDWRWARTPVRRRTRRRDRK